MREIYALYFQCFAFYSLNRVLGDQLETDGWVNLKEKLKPCYPDDQTRCKVRSEKEVKEKNF